MATRKKKTEDASPPSEKMAINKSKQALVTLMTGAKASGLTLAEAQAALQTQGSDAMTELNQLLGAGLVYVLGQGVFALTRDADGNYCALSGNPPATSVPPAAHQPPVNIPPPVAPVPHSATPYAPTADAEDDEEEDDVPWTTGDVAVRGLDLLEELVGLMKEVRDALVKKPSIPLPAPSSSSPSGPVPMWGQAPAPPAPAAPPGYTAIQNGDSPPQYQQPQPPPQYGAPPVYQPPQQGQVPNYGQPQYQPPQQQQQQGWGPPAGPNGYRQG
jgi:hypothetical protein